MNTKKSVSKKAITTKNYEDNGIIIGSIIQKSSSNGKSFQVLELSMKNEETGKFEKIDSLSNIQGFFFNVIQLKKPVEFTSGDKKIAFIKMTPKKGVDEASAFDQSTDD